VWPVAARNRLALIESIQSRFPESVDEAARAGNALAEGRHNLLGYRDLACGSPPDWHRDPVHGARPPEKFWAVVPYLDPAYGDHKVIWELNRHQHWRTLGRAFWLTGDRKYRDVFVTELLDWILSNPPETGVNWASMLELGFRALSWTWAVEFFSDSLGQDSSPWLVDLLIALDRQLAHIARNLSRYFSPNTHLTGEALALYAVSRAFPELRSSGTRVMLGRDVLARETDRQILTDGGHAELSAHYHRYSTDFYLLALLVARSSSDRIADRFMAAVRAQAVYLRTLADDRGRLPLIGDDDGGQLFGITGERPLDASPTLAVAASVLDDVTLAIKPASEEAYWILGAAPAVEAGNEPAEWRSRLLPASGYFVSRTRSGDRLVFDAGPHGFLNGGHAHSDALSIVLTVGGEEVLIDPGTATYTMDATARDRFRSTRMHNTVVIEGRDHARPQGPFHWRERPTGQMLSTKVASTWDFAQGTHDAYGPGVHVRSVIALHGLGWIVVDQLLGTGKLTARGAWHLHPSWRPSLRPGGVTLDGGSRQLAMAFSSGVVSVLHANTFAEYSPEYGRIEPASTVCVTETDAAPFAIATFIPATSATAEPGILSIPLEQPLADGWVSAAFQLRCGDVALTALVASPRHIHASSGPAARWGTSAVRTDARALVYRVVGDQVEEVASVDARSTQFAEPLASAVHARTGEG
jgi:Heparinase II/III-like protein/Heparinase II/III N-terminus